MAKFEEAFEQGSLLENLFNEQDHAMGMRLEKLEVFNWGPYDGVVWAFRPHRGNAIISGESGSGKSTLLDAMLTLFLSGRSVTYNRAAEQGKENSNRSKEKYVLGSYAHCQDSQTGKVRRVSLRDRNTYSCLLATFSDTFGNTTTLAQIFYFTVDTLNTLYVVADKELSIADDFSDVDIKMLRTTLRRRSDIRVYTTYQEYCLDFRRHLGLLNDAALTLWQNAAFMKSVGNIDTFIKENMLNRRDMTEQIKKVHNMFGTLTDLKVTIENLAQKQKLLKEIVDCGEKVKQADQEVQDINSLSNLVEAWQLIREADTAAEKKTWEEREKALLVEKEKKLQTEQQRVQEDCNRIERELLENDGSILADLEEECRQLTQNLIRCQSNRKKFDEKIQSLDEPAITEDKEFYAFRQHIPVIREQLTQKKSAFQQKAEDMKLKFREQTKELQELQDEIANLRKHPSNIPLEYQKIRQDICKELDVLDTALPFVGELMDIRPEGKEWQGAMERLLHGFALSLVVDDKYYEEVSQYVNSHKFHEKLVYHRVSTSALYTEPPQSDTKTHVYDLLYLKEDSPYALWLQDHLYHRYDHICAKTMEEFRREKFAITREGQIKNKRRHEKFDKWDIHASSGYVIGFHNAEKLASCEQQEKDRLQEVRQIEQEYQRFEQYRAKTETQLSTLSLLEEGFPEYAAIDVVSCKIALTQKQTTLSRIQKEKGSRINALNEQKKELAQRLTNFAQEQKKLIHTQGSVDGRIDRLKQIIAEGKKAEEKILVLDISREELNRQMESCYRASHNTDKNNIHATDEKRWEKQAKIITKFLENRRGRISERKGRSSSDYQQAATCFSHQYPKEALHLSTDISCLKDYTVLLQQTEHDKRVKLASNSSNDLQENPFGVATSALMQLNVDIDGQCEKCQDLIERLNQTVGEIPFRQENRRLQICIKRSENPEIKEFRTKLGDYANQLVTYQSKGISLDSDEVNQFLTEMRPFLDRFELATEKDRDYMQRVTDARNWIQFSCIIHDKDTGLDELVRDSAEKSGGEKELLAYTILAAGLIYSFGLDSSTEEERTFRLLFVDEAFLKSSADIRDAVLNLFQKLHLQIVMITPADDISPYYDIIDRVADVTIDRTTHTSQVAMYRLVKDQYLLEQLQEEEA